MYYTYVLKSTKTSRYYKGITNNLNRRLNEHFEGKSTSTKNIRPLVLIYVHISKSGIEAREMEKFLKSGYGREVIVEIDS